MKTILSLLFLISFLLAACTGTPSQPTTVTTAETQATTTGPTRTPTITLTPAPTATSEPTATATIDPIVALIPTGSPEAAWNNIPVMAGALAGAGDESGYRYTIKAKDTEIQDFYETELKASGWTLLAAGGKETGTTLLIFTKNDKTLTVSIMAFEDVYLVMFVQ